MTSGVFGIRWSVLLIFSVLLVILLAGMAGHMKTGNSGSVSVEVSPPVVKNAADSVVQDALQSQTETVVQTEIEAQTESNSVNATLPESVPDLVEDTLIADPIIDSGSTQVVVPRLPKLSPEQRAYKESLQILRENPASYPDWYQTRSIGNLGEPPKTGIE